MDLVARQSEVVIESAVIILQGTGTLKSSTSCDVARTVTLIMIRKERSKCPLDVRAGLLIPATLDGHIVVANKFSQ